MSIEVADYPSQLDDDLPSDSLDYVYEGDDHLRLIKHVLKTTFANINGAITVTEEEINALAGITGNVESRLDAAESAITALAGAEEIPGGNTVFMVFMQNAAPTGWTFVASNNDRALINTSTVGNGGTTGGSWVVAGLTADSHTHGAGTHTHGPGSFSVTPLSVGTDAGVANTVALAGSRPVTGTSDGASGDTDGPSTQAITSDGTWRMSYVMCITCSKN